jgi:hypothetical protein
MTNLADRVEGLTKAQRFVLEWLSKEDSSAYGECRGSDLDALLSAGLAKVRNRERGDYARVELTDAGRAALLRAKESDRCQP